MEGPQLVPFTCRKHGVVLDAPASASVWCTCGLRATGPEWAEDARRRKLKRESKARRKGAGQEAV